MSERGINIKNYVESRLEEWGAWARHTGLPRLGYPSMSVILGISKQRHSASYDSVSAEAMEKLILELSREFPREAEAITVCYSTKQDKTTIARKQKTSLRTLNDRLKSGKTFLAGRLAHKLKGYE